MEPNARLSRKNRITGLFNGRRDRLTKHMNNRPKWSDATVMKMMVNTEISVESKYPTERFRVEKPPVAHTLKA